MGVTVPILQWYRRKGPFVGENPMSNQPVCAAAPRDGCSMGDAYYQALMRQQLAQNRLIEQVKRDDSEAPLKDTWEIANTGHGCRPRPCF